MLESIIADDEKGKTDLKRRDKVGGQIRQAASAVAAAGAYGKAAGSIAEVRAAAGLTTAMMQHAQTNLDALASGREDDPRLDTLRRSSRPTVR